MIEFALFCFGASALLGVMSLDELLREARNDEADLIERIRAMKWSR